MFQNTPQSPIGKRRGKLSRKFQIMVVLVACIASIALGYFFLTYWHHLSEKDFAAVEHKMDSVYASMDIKEVDRTKNCHYYEDSMGKILKCDVEMAGYIAITSPTDLPAITEDFAKQLEPISGADDIWRTPLEPDDPTRYAAFVVKDSQLRMGCSATVGTKDGSVALGRSLPKRDLTGKAVLLLQCGGASRKPYFDMQSNPT